MKQSLLYSQLNKLKRAITVQGVDFLLAKQGTNEFKEPNGENEFLEMRGLFHESSGYLKSSTYQASTIRKKSSPMVMCTWEEAQTLGIDTDCKVHYQGKVYTIQEIKDLQELNIIVDISLEEVQDDGKRIQA